MRSALISFLLLVTAVSNTMTFAQTPEEFAQAWDDNHVSDKPASDVRHADLKGYLEKLNGMGLKVGLAGLSYGGREIYQVEWGKGPFKVFMWSQMHGDEPTATPALIDMFAFLEKNKDKIAWVGEMHNRLTIRAVPMLNPDGAEVFQRRNLQWIDINRDARDLKTPEGQILKKLVDDFYPDVGFNLHNQQELTTVGSSHNQATISLLAVNGRADGSTYPGFERNKRICSVMAEALARFIPGNIGRYSDAYNGLAFGDNISAWGSPVILIETGGLHGKDESFLIKLNFIAFLSALQAIVDGSAEKAGMELYESLPSNSSGMIYNLIIRNAEIVIPGKSEQASVLSDIGINRERRRAQFIPPVYVRSIGDLSRQKGLEEFDASPYYVVPKEGVMRRGVLASFLFYKKSRVIDFDSEEFEKEAEPDGIYLFGKWVKPLE
ncbi:MAG: peptidase M14 [Acidobacteria bacterium]|nr:MAG: peptidase M14 [Acidobacteriota bacterium]REJ99167.1 MAG: peptidase M14 [Acidobacteriota bacterium]REK16112.1 MAG: peptidase M14 [Acidobacteriota bacterium]REK43793.1 MAG: peptidase M14 [Acidobacteriota bacterium]